MSEPLSPSDDDIAFCRRLVEEVRRAYEEHHFDHIELLDIVFAIHDQLGVPHPTQVDVIGPDPSEEEEEEEGRGQPPRFSR